MKGTDFLSASVTLKVFENKMRQDNSRLWCSVFNSGDDHGP